jgi:fructose-bisphosphate aldolase class II
MPIASPDAYAEMLDRAKSGGFAYPAINVASSGALNAALRGFAEAESDGIVQISWGGAEFCSGASVKSMVDGAVAMAEFARVVAKNYPVTVALHTDHCPPEKLDGYMRPLLELSIERVKAGGDPIFGSHMWDGSTLELEENLCIADELFAMSIAAHTVMELEIGVVGGEEDGIAHESNEKLYTSPKDMMRVAEVLGAPGERGRYLLAATFGNVHGSYKPGSVKLRPEILKEGQEYVGAALGVTNPFDLVFHGVSRIGARADPRDAGVRRHQDERGHRHAVRVHPADRRPRHEELRRCPQGRRGGRQQEGLRPAVVGTGGRGGHGGEGRRGLPGPQQHGHQGLRPTELRPFVR